MIVTERVLEVPRSYPVVIGPGANDRLIDHLRRVGASSEIVAVTDENVWSHDYWDPLLEMMLAAGYHPLLHRTPAGEQAKTRDQLAAVHEKLALGGQGRAVTVLALGGGAVSDLAGFAAATWMRGVDFVILSTTLLSMVDASVGGKTAINIPQGKNLVGAFHQPRFVLADTDTLATLPPEEVRSGLGEVVKTAILGDPDLFERLEGLGGLDVADPALVEIVARCVRLKAEVVARDEREAGERRVLNLGHTLGHALEAVSGFAGLRHGEAVAIGIAFVARMAADLCRLDGAIVGRILALLEALDLPTEIPSDLDRDAMAEFIAVDKKVRDGEPIWVLPAELGRCVIEPVPGWRRYLADA